MNMPHEKPFKRLWRELTAAGWKSRKPRGLSVDYIYIMPGITGRLDDSKRGVDFFVDDREESKSESDVHENPVNAFDIEQFMDALRQEDLFSAIDDDDINLCAEASTEGVDSGGEDENVIADNDTEDEGDEEVTVSAGVDDLDDSDDDDQLEPTFETTEDELSELTASGWETFDSDHCGDLKLDAAADYYDGKWGPTRSALGFDESPLGLFFYFLPKALWVRIAEEKNRFRTQSIPAMADEKRARLLNQQANDPRKIVPDLVDIIDEMRRFKAIKPHEIVHVIGLVTGLHGQ
ncbi:hypothetical protein BBJ28_00022454 [Nothophytophthora sp. Chile5]|nr:hypothetical protein BBJ28_00022454 [Nothophytophthora sp. Chile5]